MSRDDYNFAVIALCWAIFMMGNHLYHQVKLGDRPPVRVSKKGH